MYINTALNYTGSKYRLLEQIIPHFDYTKKNFYDIFAGGGSVFTNVVDKYDNIFINDIISDIIEIHKSLIFDNSNFVTNVKELYKNKDSQQDYLKLRESYNKEKSPDKLYALILSCTNNLMRFNSNGGFNQTHGKRCFNEQTQKKIDIWFNHINSFKDKLNFTNFDFNDIKPISSSMVYLDPPYGYISENGIIKNKQITEAGYSTTWKIENEIKLYEYCLMLDSQKHSFMLSNVFEHDGKISWICEKLISNGFKYKELDFNYKKVSRNKIDKKTIEVIITNYNI